MSNETQRETGQAHEAPVWQVEDFQPTNYSYPVASYKVGQFGNGYKDYSPDRVFLVLGEGAAGRLAELLNALTQPASEEGQ